MRRKRTRILAACKDRGGSNILLPAVKRLRQGGFDVTLLGYETSEKFFKEQGVKFNTIKDFGLEKADEESMAKLLFILKPGLILLGTSWRESIEKPLAAAGKKQGITTVAVLDYWSNYRKRFFLNPDNGTQEDFEKYSPDYFLVMSKFAKREAVREGFKKSSVIIVGQPYFDGLQKERENFKQLEKTAFRKKMKISGEEITVLFLSQSLEEMALSKGKCEKEFGFCPVEVVNFIVKALGKISTENKKKFVLVIKTHPAEKYGKYAELEKIKSPRVIIDNNSDARQLILGSDFVLGMHSITLFDALVLGKPVLSIQPNLKIRDPLYLDGKQLIPAVYEKGRIKKSLEAFLFEKKFSNLIEKNMVFFAKAMQIDGKSMERIMHFIKKLLAQKNGSK